MTDTSRYVCEICGESFEHQGGKGAHVNWNHPEATSEETIIDEIQRLAAEKGRPPKIMEMNDEGCCAGNTVTRIFGSWEDALRAAEISPIHRHSVPEKELLDDIRSVARQLSRPPTAAEYDAQGIVSRRTAQERFGGWNEALKQAGLTPHIRKNIPEEELLDEIHRLADELGQTPTSADMNEGGRFSDRGYFSRFGTWRAAVRAAGYEPRGYSTGPDHHSWVENPKRTVTYYGQNWKQRREQALERDGFECQSPGCGLSNVEHRKRFGTSLEVHHIAPIRMFIDEDGDCEYTQANAVENLVTLCASHHRLWEKMCPLQPDIRHL